MAGRRSRGLLVLPAAVTELAYELSILAELPSRNPALAHLTRGARKILLELRNEPRPQRLLAKILGMDPGQVSREFAVLRRDGCIEQITDRARDNEFGLSVRGRRLADEAFMSLNKLWFDGLTKYRQQFPERVMKLAKQIADTEFDFEDLNVRYGTTAELGQFAALTIAASDCGHVGNFGLNVPTYMYDLCHKVTQGCGCYIFLVSDYYGSVNAGLIASLDKVSRLATVDAVCAHQLMIGRRQGGALVTELANKLRSRGFVRLEAECLPEVGEFFAQAGWQLLQTASPASELFNVPYNQYGIDLA